MQTYITSFLGSANRTAKEKATARWGVVALFGDLCFFALRNPRSEGWDEEPSCRAGAWIIVGIGGLDVVAHLNGLLAGVITASYYTIHARSVLHQEGIVATASHLSLEVLGIGLVAESAHYDVVVLEQAGIGLVDEGYLLLTVTSLSNWSSALRCGVADWSNFLYFGCRLGYGSGLGEGLVTFAAAH